MIPANRFFRERLNGAKGRAFRSLGGRSAFHVYKIGPNYFLLTKNKAGELHRINKKTYRKTYNRYLHLKKSGYEKRASQYGNQKWPGCPDVVLCPYLAAIK
jgi:hypothetical protein